MTPEFGSYPRIITDSTSDISSETAERHGIDVIPAVIMFHGQSYRDRIDQTMGEFLSRLADSEDLPTTAAPGLGVFLSEMGKSDRKIISIHVGSNFSGFYSNAVSAAREIDPGGDRISVYDSGSVSMGLGFLVFEAARLSSQGLDTPEIVKRLDKMRKQTTVIAVLDTVENLRRGGRISLVKNLMATVLRIKPILEIRENTFTAIENVRTRSKSIERLIDLVKARAPFEKLAVVHAAAEGDAIRVAAELMSLYPENIPVLETGPALATHAGPGTVAVCLVQADRTSTDQFRT